MSKKEQLLTVIEEVKFDEGIAPVVPHNRGFECQASMYGQDEAGNKYVIKRVDTITKLNEFKIIAMVEKSIPRTSIYTMLENWRVALVKGRPNRDYVTDVYMILVQNLTWEESVNPESWDYRSSSGWSGKERVWHLDKVVMNKPLFWTYYDSNYHCGDRAVRKFYSQFYHKAKHRTKSQFRVIKSMPKDMVDLLEIEKLDKHLSKGV